MGEFIDKTKGKAKETAGVVSGDRRLESEGKIDTAKGNVKGAFERVKAFFKRGSSDVASTGQTPQPQR